MNEIKRLEQIKSLLEQATEEHQSIEDELLDKARKMLWGEGYKLLRVFRRRNEDYVNGLKENLEWLSEEEIKIKKRKKRK